MPTPRREIAEATAVGFRATLRQGREAALANAESFMEVIHPIEDLGRYLTNDAGAKGLAKYTEELVLLAERSPLGRNGFRALMDALREARNDAAHIGAAARRITAQAVNAAIILEDAMAHAAGLRLVEHYMVENPTCAEGWQTVAMVRTVMLRSQFSQLPLRRAGEWHLLTDTAVVRFLSESRAARLLLTVEEAIMAGLETVRAATTPDSATLDREHVLTSSPVLLAVDDRGNLRGILTPFDLL